MIHQIGQMHAESPMRLQPIDTELRSEGLMLDLIQFESEPASLTQFKCAHACKYVREIEQIRYNATIGGLSLIDNDTSIELGPLRAALLANGTGCQVVDHVMTGNIQRAFCTTGPPGHHAESLRLWGSAYSMM